MLEKTKGIIVKNTRYSETSVITRVYTLEHGMLSFLIPGIYSSKAAIKPAQLQPLLLTEIDFYFRENKNLLKIKELKNIYSGQESYSDMTKTTIEMVMSEIIYKTIREEEANPELYLFLEQSIQSLNEPTHNRGNFLITFMLEYSKFLGFYPENNFSADEPFFHLTEGKFTHHSDQIMPILNLSESELLHQLICNVSNHLVQIEFNREKRLKLTEVLISYYQVHVPRFVKLNSFNVMKNVLGD